jgi:hypothetical protein
LERGREMEAYHLVKDREFNHMQCMTPTSSKP